MDLRNQMLTVYQETENNVSSLTLGEQSYIADLAHQKTSRSQTRSEAAMEEALELYKLALDEGAPESEQLFLAIFSQVQKELEEEYKEKDRLQEQRLQAALLSELHRQQKEGAFGSPSASSSRDFELKRQESTARVAQLDEQILEEERQIFKKKIKKAKQMMDDIVREKGEAGKSSKKYSRLQEKQKEYIHKLKEFDDEPGTSAAESPAYDWGGKTETSAADAPEYDWGGETETNAADAPEYDWGDESRTSPAESPEYDWGEESGSTAADTPEYDWDATTATTEKSQRSTKSKKSKSSKAETETTRVSKQNATPSSPSKRIDESSSASSPKKTKSPRKQKRDVLKSATTSLNRKTKGKISSFKVPMSVVPEEAEGADDATNASLSSKSTVRSKSKSPVVNPKEKVSKSSRSTRSKSPIRRSTSSKQSRSSTKSKSPIRRSTSAKQSRSSKSPVRKTKERTIIPGEPDALQNEPPMSPLKIFSAPASPSKIQSPTTTKSPKKSPKKSRQKSEPVLKVKAAPPPSCPPKKTRGSSWVAKKDVCGPAALPVKAGWLSPLKAGEAIAAEPTTETEPHKTKASCPEYTLKDFQEGNVSEHVDLEHWEQYLTDQEFEKCFKMSKSAFFNLASWKQNQAKRIYRTW